MNGLKTLEIQGKIPKYNYPVNERMINLGDGRLMTTLDLKGIPFESESSEALSSAFNSVKIFLSLLSKKYGSQLGLWTHIIKSETKLEDDYKFDSDFVQAFSDKYIETFQGETFFKTSYNMTFVYKYKGSLDNGINLLDDLLKIVKSSLKRFEPVVLGVSKDGSRCRNIEFLSFLLNNKNITHPLVSSKVSASIGHSDWHFGYDVLELRNADSEKSKYATFYELDSYPSTTSEGIWDFILGEKSEFVLTQSMIFIKPHEAAAKIDTQINLIESSDAAEHELNELYNAKDFVATGELGFGDYHFSLAVFGKTADEAITNGSDISGEFLARNTIIKRSNLKSCFTFLSALPASKTRIMPSPRSTTNLACTFSLHNYSQGKKAGNPIGDGSALIPLKTTSDSLLYFNCHASDIDKNVTGEKYAGHTLFLGASGTGKTTTVGTVVAFATRFNPQIFAIDYKRSTELFMKAFGGQYFTIEEGVDTGLNLFQLKDSANLRSFLNRLVYTLGADNDGFCTEEEEAEIKSSIDSMLDRVRDVNKLGLSLLLQNIQSPGLRARLGKWCRSENGQLSWCLDSPINTFDPETMDIVGFDSTVLLEPGADGKPHPASEPVLSALFFLKNLMQKSGRLFLTIVEEFWMPANYPLTQGQIKASLKAGRLQGEFMLLSSQSPEDAINCAIFPEIMQQTVTKIFLPNPEAEFDSYKKCNLSRSEFDKLKALDKLSRKFLVKQSNTSCFAKLYLFGFDDFLPIISGTTEDMVIVDKIISQHGSDPNVWIPIFQKHKKLLKELKS